MQSGAMVILLSGNFYFILNYKSIMQKCFK